MAQGGWGPWGGPRHVSTRTILDFFSYENGFLHLLQIQRTEIKLPEGIWGGGELLRPVVGVSKTRGKDRVQLNVELDIRDKCCKEERVDWWLPSSSCTVIWGDMELSTCNMSLLLFVVSLNFSASGWRIGSVCGRRTAVCKSNPTTACVPWYIQLQSAHTDIQAALQLSSQTGNILLPPLQFKLLRILQEPSPFISVACSVKSPAWVIWLFPRCSLLGFQKHGLHKYHFVSATLSAEAW